MMADYRFSGVYVRWGQTTDLVVYMLDEGRLQI